MPSLRRSQHLLIGLITTLIMGGCFRGPAVKDEPGPAYALQVNNPMSYPVIVWYDDGTGSHLLGTVSAGTEGRFVITRPSQTEVTVRATDEDQTHTITRTVTLQQGEVSEITLTR